MELKVDPIVEMFEDKIKEYTGAPYAVAVSSATNGLFLTLEAMKKLGTIVPGSVITVPSRTYYSVPMSIVNSGFSLLFRHAEWKGEYQLYPTPIYDSATYLKKGMYEPGTIKIISTQYRKGIPVGRGGVILTDNRELVDFLRIIRINGNEEVKGWNMYMTPEQAARGLSLMERMKEPGVIATFDDYPDISGWKVWKE